MKITTDINVTTLRWMQVVLHFMETGLPFTEKEFAERCEGHEVAMKFSLVDLVKTGAVRKHDGEYTIAIPEMRGLMEAVVKDGSVGYHAYADTHTV